MGFLAGKRAVIVGLASNRSIAWGIAQAMRREGAELAFGYQNDKLKSRVEGMAAELGSDLTLPLDVAEDAQIDAFFAGLAKRWDGFDMLVHSARVRSRGPARRPLSRRRQPRRFSHRARRLELQPRGAREESRARRCAAAPARC